MKYLIILSLLFASTSCNRVRYQSRFYDMFDSTSLYYYKFLRYTNERNDSSKEALRLQLLYSDSLKYYYKLMYPNGNPSDKNNSINACK